MNTVDTTFWEIARDLDDLDRLDHPDDDRRLDARIETELQRLDAERIASAAFCGTGLDPTVLSFATLRAAQHWGLAEDEMDLRIATAIVQTASRLAAALAP